MLILCQKTDRAYRHSWLFWIKNLFLKIIFIECILINLPGILRGAEHTLHQRPVAKNPFYVNKPRQENLGWIVLRRLKYLPKDILGLPVWMISTVAIFLSSGSPTVPEGARLECLCASGRPFGAMLLLCWSHKSFNLGSFLDPPYSPPKLPLSGDPLINEDYLTDWTL